MRVAVAILVLLVSSGAGSAAECTDFVSAMRQANVRYRNGVTELRMLQRDLGPVGSRSEETVLRALRRYALGQRDLRDQRITILALYRNLVDGACEPFDQQGYDVTADDFRFATNEEEAVLASARRVMATTAAAR